MPLCVCCTRYWVKLKRPVGINIRLCSFSISSDYENPSIQHTFCLLHIIIQSTSLAYFNDVYYSAVSLTIWLIWNCHRNRGFFFSLISISSSSLLSGSTAQSLSGNRKLTFNNEINYIYIKCAFRLISEEIVINLFTVFQLFYFHMAWGHFGEVKKWFFRWANEYQNGFSDLLYYVS